MKLVNLEYIQYDGFNVTPDWPMQMHTCMVLCMYSLSSIAISCINAEKTKV